MSKPGYQITKDKSRLKVRFVFISKGSQDIIKLIDYDYIGLYHDTKTFNLGFGDYDPITGQIDDHVYTDNGDVYNVLNTVLNTIPLFFEEYPSHSLMVKGSDTGKAFVTRCKADCKKSCKTTIGCKNQNRRINVYTRYVSTNYSVLMKEYVFPGGNEDTVEPFIRNQKYDTAFLLKNITLQHEN